MRHDNPLDPSGNRVVGRTLLQTEVVVQGDADVRLALPTTPWNRFEVEVDDIASTANNVIFQARFGVDGSVRAGANDYEFVSSNEYADGVDRFSDRSSAFIGMSSDADNVRFGTYEDVDSRIPMNTGSYHCWITPGNATDSTPKISWRGAYYSSEGINDRRIVRPSGSGLYKGWTTLVYGRADEVQFFFNTDTIDRGTFRLYGTE